MITRDYLRVNKFDLAGRPIWPKNLEFFDREKSILNPEPDPDLKGSFFTVSAEFYEDYLLKLFL